MELLKNRPLAVAALMLVISLFLAFCLQGVILLIGVCLIGALLLGLGIYSVVKRRFTYHTLALVLLCCGALAGAARGCFYQKSAEKTWESRLDSSVQVELVVEEICFDAPYGTELLVRVDRLNQKSCSDRAVLRFEGWLGYSVRDRIAGKVLVKNIDFESYNETTLQIYRGDGVCTLLICEDKADLALLESGENSFAVRLENWKEALAARMTNACEGEAGRLLAAVLLGTREDLGVKTVRDFRRIGVSHLLAISGLHLVMLVGTGDRLFMLMRIKKHIRMWLLILLCIFYLFLTGCSYSMIRAVLMLGAAYLSFFLRSDHDSFTVLSLCAAVIVFASPYALFSTSFQMTMLATFGILIYGEVSAKVKRRKLSRRFWCRFLQKAGRYLTSSVLISLCSTLALLPVLWLTFKEISLLTPLANLIFVPLSTILLSGAMLLLALPVRPIGFAVGALSKLLLWLAGEFSAIPCVLSLGYAFVPFVLIPMLAATLFLLLINLKKRTYLIALPFTAALLAFGICFAAQYAARRDEIDIIYTHTWESEQLILLHQSSAVICDSTGGSLSALFNGWYTAKDAGACEIEALVLTHYHKDFEEALARFFDSVMVRMVWLPSPYGSERRIHKTILQTAQRHGIEVKIYENGEELSVFDGGSLRVDRFEEEDVGHGIHSIAFSFGEERICYHTALFADHITKEPTSHACKASTLFLGSHGVLPKEGIKLPDHSALELVVIGDETVLKALELREDVKYLAFPEILTFRFGSK